MTLASLYETNRTTFVRKIRPYVRGYDVAEDIVQDAFTRAVSRHKQYDPRKGSLKGWFTKILFSCVWSYLRAVRKSPPTFDIDLVSESELPATEEEINLYEYIENTHNPCHKQVLIGYFVLGYSYKELAEMLGMTQDNCRKVVQRFRDQEKVNE